ncbi:effector-associated domain EAD1-containing protein [Actinoplanes missouriensis]|uniref:effector-associated domain EAD1-containing protein n=1 Tax=Actinoplanes missouriensis TaxID=1866 RepID=UPI003410F3AE
MAIDGVTARMLSEALLDAFLPDRLDQMLFYRLGKHRHRITMKTDYESIVFDLIMAADAEGWLPRLVTAARESRPADPGLVAVAGRLHLTADTGGHLESILDTRAPDIHPARFRAALGLLEGQICRIERRTPTGPAPLGTGFLIGPDLCMTSHHVVRPLIDGRIAADDVSLRFDYKHTAAPAPASAAPASAAPAAAALPGTVFVLARDWLVASAPNSAFEDRDGEPAELPEPGELDFAVLRVAGEPGEQPIGADAEPGAARRGWIEAVHRGPLRAGDDLLVLQHLMGEPLRLAFGRVSELNGNGTRLKHTANTEAGSSGSPCFTLALELAAIHQAGDPNRESWHVPAYNRAVPAEPIFTALRR